MDISSVNNAASINAISNKSSAYLEAVRPNQHEAKVSNNVTISEAGRTAAKYDMEGDRSNYPPLEMFQVPAWLGDYSSSMELLDEINQYSPYVAPTNGVKLAEIPKQYRDEYSEIVRRNYHQTLINAGVDTFEKHYESVINKNQSHILENNFKHMMDNDPRVIAMLNNR
ncbi:hypothetical protein [Neptunomonas qingdaonensis]|uniref:Uncharacterized protein n=1 Tax=Neptunomonas qingdaonensis TaxID=1045558 RepID=A0A1I2N2G0_9GAMM|nr:hypothetical protein [Neptunomonas qingdaonensis]SFF98044.1 hypothetical protein SAMN05216175_102258 [Neptunomonas qingdaonensis]